MQSSKLINEWKNSEMVLLHFVSLRLGDISSSLWSSLFTWVTRQAVAACPRHAASCVCHLPPPSCPMIPKCVSDNGHRAGKWTSGAPVPRTPTSAPLCSVRVQIWCVMIWQSDVAELRIAETRPPACRPTGRPYGRRRSALNSSSSALTLLLACSSFLMNPRFEWRFHPGHSSYVTLFYFPTLVERWRDGWTWEAWKPPHGFLIILLVKEAVALGCGAQKTNLSYSMCGESKHNLCWPRDQSASFIQGSFHLSF